MVKGQQTIWLSISERIRVIYSDVKIKHNEYVLHPITSYHQVPYMYHAVYERWAHQLGYRYQISDIKYVTYTWNILLIYYYLSIHDMTFCMITLYILMIVIYSPNFITIFIYSIEFNNHIFVTLKRQIWVKFYWILYWIFHWMITGFLLGTGFTGF